LPIVQEPRVLTHHILQLDDLRTATGRVKLIDVNALLFDQDEKTADFRVSGLKESVAIVVHLAASAAPCDCCRVTNRRCEQFLLQPLGPLFFIKLIGIGRAAIE
jgi:hypothetical protein